MYNAAAERTIGLSAPTHTSFAATAHYGAKQAASVGPGSSDMPPAANPDTVKRPSTVEYGNTGTVVIAGQLVLEEYNGNLAGKAGLRVFDKMRRSDPIVRQGLVLGDVPILSAVKKIAPASPQPQHIEQAAFIETAMFHSLEGQTFDDVLRQVLLYRPFGFSLLEKVFKYDDSGNVLWKKFAPRLPRTIYRWWEGGGDQGKDLVGVQQWSWDPGAQSYFYHNIPIENLIRFTYQQEGNNYEGLSVLRSAYKPWWQKQAYEKLQSVGFEREHVGIPTISLPDGYSDGDIARAAQIGRNARSNEIGYILLPPGWGVEFLKSRGGEKKGSSVQDAIKYCDLQIQNNVLAGFMSLGQSGTGSYAASTDQSTLLLKAIQGDAAFIASRFSMDAIPQLVKFNFKDAVMFPRLVFQNVQAYNVKEIIRGLYDAATAGLLRPTVEVEDYIYNLIGIPRPPGNLVESTGPDGQRNSSLKPDETGLTPLPLTPEEEIAIANRQAKDLQKISVQKPGGTGSSSDRGNQARISAPKSSRMTERPNEVYISYLMERNERPMSQQQLAIYCRMAAEAGRPSITLTGDYSFASATALAEPARHPEQLSRLNRRQAMSSDLADEIKAGMDEMRRDLISEVGGSLREYVDEQIDQVDES